MATFFIAGSHFSKRYAESLKLDEIKSFLFLYFPSLHAFVKNTSVHHVQTYLLLLTMNNDNFTNFTNIDIKEKKQCDKSPNIQLYSKK